MTSASKLLEVARAQVGVREGQDSNGNWNNRTEYTTWYAGVVGDKAFLTAAWCDIFISWCARQAGIPTTVIPNSAYTPATLNWYKARGRQVSTPEAGDIGYIYYASVGAIGHTFIVERRDGNYITTIEGNTNTNGSSQGNGVYRLRRQIDSRMRFARPAYGTASKPQPKPVVSVAHLKEARHYDPQQADKPLGEYKNEVGQLEQALRATEWIRPEDCDGHYGSNTVGDGSMGYGGVTGFQKKHMGEKNPDGWLGKEGLKKLFSLAKMDVDIVD